jgi:hypothetical protein
MSIRVAVCILILIAIAVVVYRVMRRRKGPSDLR